MLRLRHNNTDDDRVLQHLDLLLELSLKGLDELAVSPQADLIGGLISLLRAVVSFSDPRPESCSQVDETALLEALGRATDAGDRVP